MIKDNKKKYEISLVSSSLIVSLFLVCVCVRHTPNVGYIIQIQKYAIIQFVCIFVGRKSGLLLSLHTVFPYFISRERGIFIYKLF